MPGQFGKECHRVVWKQVTRCTRPCTGLASASCHERGEVLLARLSWYLVLEVYYVYNNSMPLYVLVLGLFNSGDLDLPHMYSVVGSH